jgi:hypothetical protein
VASDVTAEAEQIDTAAVLARLMVAALRGGCGRMGGFGGPLMTRQYSVDGSSRRPHYQTHKVITPYSTNVEINNWPHPVKKLRRGNW